MNFEIVRKFLDEEVEKKEQHKETKIESLSDIRKILKTMGYGVNIKSFSFGKSATYKHLESGESMTGNVGSASYWEKWNTLNKWREDNKSQLKEFGKKEGISGL